ncbi:RNA-binding protein MRN1 [Wickerhamiella sorbophila]|uniref:RNA-binding protein MRN1 n=1 Tax=Wickerhamiella sorbophila TaxID=45607 RepID=A0A2T0FNZ8_9ASCO|nr:RNA-binding protein MRN1 [Wickerhamiella sorbophila]PRT56705.1 RNA-binding protein MRN1 [Wickerhamiella sorbophila]
MLVTKQHLAAPLVSSATAPLTNDQDTSLECWRSLYLSNLPSNATATSILNLVTTGLVENMRYIPHKNAAYISFLDHAAASEFFTSLIINGPVLGGNRLFVSWARAPPLSKEVKRAVEEDGACRNVYIGNLPSTVTENDVCKALASCGIIETIKVNYSTRVAFAHFQSISSAIKAVKTLNETPPWNTYKIAYGKDRCLHFSRMQRQAAAIYLGISSKSFSLDSISNEAIARTLAQQSSAAITVATTSGGIVNIGNRCVLLSQLPHDVRLDEICNATRGGVLEKIVYSPTTKVCFVTFIDPIAATQFYALWSLYPLSIRRQSVTVSWGPHPGPLEQSLAEALNHGATRNVYLGNISPELSKSQLLEDFSKFGEIEQINFLPERMCAFVNFTDIRFAMTAVESVPKLSKYRNVRIRFGKDRCGRQPRLLYGGRLTENMPLGWVLFEYLTKSQPFYAHTDGRGPNGPIVPAFSGEHQMK